jgi:hypothetical protein
MSTNDNHNGEYVAFCMFMHIDMVLYYEYQIYNDKIETVYCPDGFGIYYTSKKYYNKQFINLILQQKDHK